MPRNATDFDEATVLDGDIRRDPRIALSVEDASVANDDVVQRVGSLRVCDDRDRDERGSENEWPMHDVVVRGLTC